MDAAAEMVLARPAAPYTARRDGLWLAVALLLLLAWNLSGRAWCVFGVLLLGLWWPFKAD